MTADPRVSEVRDVPLAYRPENRQAATDDLIRMLTASSDIPGDVKLPREAVNMLLAALRDRNEKLARVEAVASRLEARVAQNKRNSATGIYDDAMELAAHGVNSIATVTAADIRAAVAAAGGGGQ